MIVWLCASGHRFSRVKTEYRYSEFRTDRLADIFTATGLPTGFTHDSHKYVSTVRSELVWRFNWGGPVVANY